MASIKDSPGSNGTIFQCIFHIILNNLYFQIHCGYTETVVNPTKYLAPKFAKDDKFDFRLTFFETYIFHYSFV